MRDVVLIVGVLAVAFAISYRLLLAGEPTSVWLWRDVFHFSP